MNRKEWFFVLFPLFAVLALDQATKAWAETLEGMRSFGLIGFVLHHNPGAMLGLFSDLPPVLRVVSLSTGGAFLVCIYAIIQYLLPTKSLILRGGLSVLLGGILGNVVDRIIYGYIVDFIVIGNVSLSSPAFNVADALQWVGYGMIVYAIFKDGDKLWPENEARRVFWINPGFQMKYCFLLMGVGLGISLIVFVFSFTYLRVTIIDLIGEHEQVMDKFLMPFTIIFSVLSIGFSLSLFAFGKIISHKIAGPLYAFEKYVNDSLSGKNRKFKLRTKDEFQHLEILGLKIQQRLQELGGMDLNSPTLEVNIEQASLEGAKLAEEELTKIKSD